jgi:hypothetical protein
MLPTGDTLQFLVMNIHLMVKIIPSQDVEDSSKKQCIVAWKNDNGF